MLNRRQLIKMGFMGLAGGAGIFSILKYYRKQHTLEIVTYPDPILRKVSAAIDQVDDGIVRLAQSMIATLRYQAYFEFFLKASLYKGLAAPQIGISKRIIVCGVAGRMKAMVNPEIIDRQGTLANSEYCMSLPGHERRVIQRAKSIKVKYQALDSSVKILALQGRSAGLVQHEIDHLDGKLYIDWPGTRANMHCGKTSPS